MAIRNRIETSPEKACADSLNSQPPILRTKPLSLGTMTFDTIEKPDMPMAACHDGAFRRDQFEVDHVL